MSGGLRYETGRDMPPGMAEKVAVQIARRMVATAPAVTPETPPVAGSAKRTIDAADLQDLKECLDWDRDEFPRALKDCTGIVAKPYTAFQYYYENGDYIGDSDYYSIEDVLKEVGIEVADDGK